MKKLFLAIITTATVLSCAGCAKTCNCVSRFDDQVLERTVTLEEGERCGDSDYDVTALGHHSSLKCRPQLF